MVWRVEVKLNVQKLSLHIEETGPVFFAAQEMDRFSTHKSSLFSEIDLQT